jgi:hypothetical protein
MFARAVLCLLLAIGLGFVLSNARAAGSSTDEIRYVVEPGDTLWAIAADRSQGDPRGTVWRLQQRNGLTTGALTPGMVLYLPP